MAKVFNKLFLYSDVFVDRDLIIFKDVKIYKSFPKENPFYKSDKEIWAVIDPVISTVYLATYDWEITTEVIGLKEWIQSDGLCRTDSHSYHFSSTVPPLQNAYMDTR